jgi:plastocyanin
MRRLALLAVVIAAFAALPATAPAARRHAAKCGKRAVCRGAVRARSASLPLAWRTGAPTAGGQGTVTIHPVTSAPGVGNSPPPPPPPPAPTGNPHFLAVATDDSDASHWYLTPSRASVQAGSVTVEFNNATAQDPHDLHFKQLSGGTGAFGLAEADTGEVATHVVSLSAGTWKLYCGIAGHEAQGMKAQISVLPPG